MRARAWTVSAVLAVLACAPPALSAEGPASGAGVQEPASDLRLDAIRKDLEELRFEKALSSIEGFLADPALTEEQRVSGLILRAQAHVSYGDLDAAEKDYRDLLELRPAYVPEASLTPPKAMARFTKARDALVGSVRLTLAPPGASVAVDGSPVVPAADGTIPVLAGKRTLSATNPGFDPQELVVDVPAGGTVPASLSLVPNARTLVFRTDPPGVTVSLDGKSVGETSRGPTAASDAFGELVVENVSLGEHAFRFAKPCFRSQTLQDIVTVDLEETTPKLYKPVVLEPVRSSLKLEGAPAGSEVRVDGEPVGSAPVERLELCPGERTVVVRLEGRTVWRSQESLAADREVTLAVRPRPNAVLIGTAAWPSDLETMTAEVNTIATGLPAPAAPEDAASWSGVTLPADADLAVAVLPPATAGAPERWMIYSPLLHVVRRLDGAGFTPRRPAWTVTVLGLRMVDSRVGGPARIVRVDAGGPAAKAGIVPGDRMIAIGGAAVADSSEAAAAIAASPAGVALDLEIESLAGKRRTVRVRGASSPWLRPEDRRTGVEALWLAAWAAADGAAGGTPQTRSTALANLALLLSDAGRGEAALETWRRVHWGERAGIAEATADYYAGRELERLSREKEAEQAYRRASRASARTFTDEGPRVAPAASDHLADLGVAASAPAPVTAE